MVRLVAATQESSNIRRDYRSSAVPVTSIGTPLLTPEFSDGPADRFRRVKQTYANFSHTSRRSYVHGQREVEYVRRRYGAAASKSPIAGIRA